MRGTKEQLTDEQRCIVRRTNLVSEDAYWSLPMKVNVS